MSNIEDFYKEHSKEIGEDDDVIISSLVAGGEDTDVQSSVRSLLKEIRKQAFEEGMKENSSVKNVANMAFPKQACSVPGMTLRDWFMGMALAGLSACPGVTIQGVINLAPEIADKIMEARKTEE